MFAGEVKIERADCFRIDRFFLKAFEFAWGTSFGGFFERIEVYRLVGKAKLFTSFPVVIR